MIEGESESGKERCRMRRSHANRLPRHSHTLPRRVTQTHMHSRPFSLAFFPTLSVGEGLDRVWLANTAGDRVTACEEGRRTPVDSLSLSRSASLANAAREEERKREKIQEDTRRQKPAREKQGKRGRRLNAPRGVRRKLCLIGCDASGISLSLLLLLLLLPEVLSH